MLEEQTTIDGPQAALNSPAPPTQKERKLFTTSLEYFGTMTDEDQFAIFQDLSFDTLDFSQAVNEHRSTQLAELDTAIETIKKARKKSASKKSELLRLRYIVEIKRLTEAGITGKEIVGYLKDKHRFTVKEPAVKSLIADIKTEEILKSCEQCEEIEKYEEWTNQQLAHHLNGKFAIRTAAAVVKRVRAELEKKANE